MNVTKFQNEVYIQNSAVTLYTSNEQLEDKNFKKQPHLQ